MKSSLRFALVVPVLVSVSLARAATEASQPVDVISEDTARFTHFLRSPVPERRIEGIQGLSNLKHWPSEEPLRALLDDAMPGVRREAVLALCRLGTAKSVPRLIALLDDPSWEIRENARLGLVRMTGQNFDAEAPAEAWAQWWRGNGLPDTQSNLLAVARGAAPNSRPPNSAQRTANTSDEIAPGRRRRMRPASVHPSASPERRDALRALRHLATTALEPALLELLQQPQRPALDADERAFVCETLERIGSALAVPALARETSDAAAWALGRIGGAAAEQALLKFPKTLPVLLALDRLHSTNAAALVPQLVGQMALITYRSHPDDVMNEREQPIQRVSANLIRRSGQAPILTELVLQELEDTMKPPIPHGARPACPPDWDRMLKAMRSELKPGFVREDGTTTSQPVAALCYMAEDPTLAKRLMPLLRHPAFVPRVYVALTLGRLHAQEAVPSLVEIIREGYAFSDSTALASGKHFDQSQTVRWRGFLCFALGRLGGDEARAALEQFAADPGQSRDIRYGAVVGLGFIGSAKSLPVLERISEQDVIWMVRNEAQRTAEAIHTMQLEARE